MNTQAIALIVVGNNLTNFSQNEGVITLDQLHLLVRNYNPKSMTSFKLTMGQGISEVSLKNLKQLITKSKLNSKFKLCPHSPQKCSKQLTHKRKVKNILISEPEQLTSTKYAAHLMVDEACAEMSDHLTGQHLQGMVLIEAARQMTLAVTEKYLISKDFSENISFITNSLETKFCAFAFPIPTQLNYEILNIRGFAADNRGFKVKIQFIQSNQMVTEIVYNFSIFNKAFLEHRETTSAGNAISGITGTNKNYHIAA